MKWGFLHQFYKKKGSINDWACGPVEKLPIPVSPSFFFPKPDASFLPFYGIFDILLRQHGRSSSPTRPAHLSLSQAIYLSLSRIYLSLNLSRTLSLPLVRPSTIKQLRKMNSDAHWLNQLRQEQNGGPQLGGVQKWQRWCVYGAWSTTMEMLFKRRSTTIFYGDPWWYGVQCNFLFKMVPSTHDESARIDGMHFYAKWKKLWQLIRAKRSLIWK